MRLDHLLSKERLAVVVARVYSRRHGPEPGDRTSDPIPVLMGGTLTSSDGREPSCEYGPREFFRVRKGRAERDRLSARCWVLRERHTASQHQHKTSTPLHAGGRGFVAVRTVFARTAPLLIFTCGVRGEPGAGTARTLRTAQWTRASLWSS